MSKDVFPGKENQGDEDCSAENDAIMISQHFTYTPVNSKRFVISMKVVLSGARTPKSLKHTV